MNVIINTKRLIIRNFHPEDWKAVLEYTSNNEVMKYIPGGLLSEKRAKDLIKENIGKNVEKYPVILKGKNALIGHMVFHKWSGEKTYEIGWVFNPDYHNMGLATEAARAIIKYSFEELNIHRIIATCQARR